MSKAIIPICEHIKDDGIRCGSPALRGRKLCYFHDRERRGHRISRTAPAKLIPTLKNQRDVRVATINVLRAARQGLFTAEELKSMFYGLQVARSTMPPSRRKRQSRSPW